VNDDIKFNLSFRMTKKQALLYSCLFVAGASASVIYGINYAKESFKPKVKTIVIEKTVEIEDKTDYSNDDATDQVVYDDPNSAIIGQSAYNENSVIGSTLFGCKCTDIHEGKDTTTYTYLDMDGKSYSVEIDNNIVLPAGYVPPSPAHALIISFEKFEPRAYWDYKQYTNGYGTRALSENEVIDVDEAICRFEESVGKAMRIAQEHAISWNSLYALTSLTYNAGSSWTKGSIAKNPNDELLVKNTIQKYVYVTLRNGKKKKLQGLVSRRKKEVSIFF